MNSDLKAWRGSHVELELKYPDGEVERLALDIVADAQADFEHGLLGEGTPLARAIDGLQAGAVVSYLAGGGPVKVRILAVNPARKMEGNLAAERAERVRKAIEDRNQMSAILFASSTDTKWGEYDPDVLKTDDHDKEKE